MRATLGRGPVFPLEKAWFAGFPMSMSGFSSSRPHCAYVWAWRLLLVGCDEWEADMQTILVQVFPCCDDLFLRKCLWGICDIRRVTCGLEKANGIFLAKRSGWIVHMGSGGCNAVSQYWNMLACSLGWKVKNCYVILGSLKNFIGDHLSKMQ